MGFQLPEQGLRWKPADLGEDHHADTKHLPSGALPKIGRWWRWKILWGHPSTDRSESQRVLCSFLVRVRDSQQWRVSVASFFFNHSSSNSLINWQWRAGNLPSTHLRTHVVGPRMVECSYKQSSIKRILIEIHCPTKPHARDCHKSSKIDWMV